MYHVRDLCGLRLGLLPLGHGGLGPTSARPTTPRTKCSFVARRCFCGYSARTVPFALRTASATSLVKPELLLGSRKRARERKMMSSSTGAPIRSLRTGTRSRRAYSQSALSQNCSCSVRYPPFRPAVRPPGRQGFAGPCGGQPLSGRTGRRPAEGYQT